MIDLPRLNALLDAEDLGDWAIALEPLIEARIADNAHGDLQRWRDAIARLPDVDRIPAELDADAVGAPALALDAGQTTVAREALLELCPWRKGPLVIGDIRIDTEWRSDLKWDRIARVMSPLEGRLILDVGCGNGYYALRMLGAGARAVIGIDPTLLYVAQFAAISRFLEPLPAHVLPLRMTELPGPARRFDTVFSMGVLYHQRAPMDHLRELRGALRRGGELILETLVLPHDEAWSRTPPERYARMRNVWHLPSVAELEIWLARAGFDDVTVAERTATTTEEQRSTEWMPFESLADALDPDDPTRTVEGWPAPLRAVVRATV